MSRLRVIAGSVRWKKRRRSRSPPRMRTVGDRSVAGRRSVTASKPKLRRHGSIQSRIIGSVFAIRSMPRLQQPSASKMPARKPLRHSLVGASGQAISSRMRSTPALAARADRLDRRGAPVAAAKRNSSRRRRSSAAGSDAPVERLAVGERKAERGARRRAGRPGRVVAVRAESAVAADHPAEVAAAVVVVFQRALRRTPRSPAARCSVVRNGRCRDRRRASTCFQPASRSGSGGRRS